MPLEIEIKLRLDGGQEKIAAILTQHGYRSGPPILEIDQVYDFPGAILRASGRLLRLRSRDSRWTLTYKGPASPGRRYKSREEIETDISDGDAFKAILNGLGYIPTFRYEKRRTTFQATEQPGIVTIDETPMGYFLELEGDPQWIDSTAALLGFADTQYITASYATLYQEYRSQRPGVPEDMTF